MQQERTPEQIAWAAGLFEGEGCWNAYKRTSGKIQVQARLGMTDKDIVERFAAIIGCGAIHEGRPGTGGHKRVYTWCVYEAEKVREIIALLLPQMGERRRAQAMTVLEVGAGVRSHNEKKTHCPQGHPLEGDNLVTEPYRRAGKIFEARRCRTCRQRQAQDRRAARAA
jgi:hypothetical protein